ncbi:hypothetical protein H257_18747 [Aphanomyces astaci]|uniref:Uncharacterized protein n=1 Tax=Aphanomyces astaci TaxID=112090 RepID=W4FA64_APHAT|nr:hypothetical protein H257_18747 [Aphanomyces astaci]ETV64352.1 hypothetical protein H257_18747 [Aphanomyces astaci]|eukprot:XP_009846170.1 hypothetical protein H257_18747 [Aphanomyces astaci]
MHLARKRTTDKFHSEHFSIFAQWSPFHPSSQTPSALNTRPIGQAVDLLAALQTSRQSAVDVTFQQTNAPAGSFSEKKRYFSKKHGMYGVASVLPNGLCVPLLSLEAMRIYPFVNPTRHFTPRP